MDHHIFKPNDHNPAYGIISGGAVLGATAGLEAPSGFPRRRSSSTRRQLAADTKAAVTNFSQQVLASLKGNREVMAWDDPGFEGGKITSGSPKTKEDQKDEVVDFSQEDTALSTDHYEDIGNCTEDVKVYTNHGEVLRMRASLDTMMEGNMIRRTMAERTQLPIKPYIGLEAQTADGHTFMPNGVMKIHFYFLSSMTGKSYRSVEFLVAPESAPFDIVLGREFIRDGRV